MYKVTTRTARKPHTCCECGESIEAKETYHAIAVKGDDGFLSLSRCQHCSDVFNNAHLLAQRDFLDSAPGPLCGELFEWISTFGNRNGNEMADELLNITYSADTFKHLLSQVTRYSK
jgi:hypothetical protein